MTTSTRSRGIVRRSLSATAASALLLSVVPAVASAQTSPPPARSTDGVCDPLGSYDRDRFDDTRGSAHERNVLCMADLGLTEGTSASNGQSYAPRDEVSRGQMASFIARFIRDYGERPLPAGEADRFDDVDSTFVHAANINALAEVGIVTGTSVSDGDLYNPQGDVDRGQTAALIRRTLSWLDNGSVTDDSAPPPGTDIFPDVDPTYVHFANINAVAGADIVQGFDDGDYRPRNPVLRDQMASFVMRAYAYADEFELGVDDEQPPVDTTPPGLVGDTTPADGAEDVPVDVTISATYDEALADSSTVTLVCDGDTISGDTDVDGETITFDPDADLDNDADCTATITATDAAGNTTTTTIGFTTVAADVVDRVETFEVDLSWINEIDGADGAFYAGEPEATGTATIIVDEADNSIEFDVDYSEVTGPFDGAPGFHVHDGDLNENGPVVVALASGAELENPRNQMLDGTVTPDEFDVSELLDDPEGYYLNLHSDLYEDGAIRGQFPDGGQDLVPDANFEVITVEPTDDQTITDGGTQSFTATGLGDLPYRITLVDAANITVDGDGNSTFVPTDAGDAPGITIANPGPPDASLISVNGADVDPTPDHTIGGVDADDDGEITFVAEVDADQPEDFVAVVYVDGRQSSFLEIDNSGAPVEFFGTSGVITADRTPTQIDELGTVSSPAPIVGNDQITFTYTRGIDDDFDDVAATAAQFELNGETATSITGNGPFAPAEQVRVIFPAGSVQPGENVITYTESDDADVRVQDTAGFDVLSPDELTFAGDGVVNITQGTTYATITEAIDDANPGEELEARGSFDEDVSVTVENLTISGTEDATLDGSFAVTASGVTIDGFDFSGYGGAVNSEAAVLISGAANVTVSGSTFTGDGPGGVIDRAIVSTPDATNSVTVEDNTFEDNNTGVFINAGDAVIDGNTFDGNNVAISNDGAGDVAITDNDFDGSVLESIGLGDDTGVTITGNRFNDDGDDAQYICVFGTSELDPAWTTGNTFAAGPVVFGNCLVAALEDGVVSNVTQGETYATIAAAVEGADAGDELVADGDYNESFTMNESVTLSGTEGSSYSGSMLVTAPDVTITGFDIPVDRNGVIQSTAAATGLLIDGNDFDGSEFTGTRRAIIGQGNASGTISNNTFTNMTQGVFNNSGVTYEIVDNEFTSATVSDDGGVAVLRHNTFNVSPGQAGYAIGGVIDADNVTGNTFLGEGTFVSDFAGTANDGELPDVLEFNTYPDDARLELASDGADRSRIRNDAAPVFNETASVTFATIQQAVDAADTGDVLVVNGEFDEIVAVTGSVTIRGTDDEDAEATVNGGFRVDADDVTIEGLTITDFGTILGELSGVYLNGSDNTTVTGNSFTGDDNVDTLDRAVLSTTGSSSTISDNTFTASNTGVFVVAGDSLIEDNTFDGNNVGVSNDGAGDVDIVGNTFSDSAFEAIGVGNKTNLAITGNSFTADNADHVCDYAGGTSALLNTTLPANTYVGHTAAITPNEAKDVDCITPTESSD